MSLQPTEPDLDPDLAKVPAATAVRLVEAREPVRLVVTGPAVKRCPFVDELDEGTVTLTWERSRWLPELHAVALYLDSYRDLHMSHENYVAAVGSDLACHVSSTWTTGGLAVVCETPR